MTSESVEIPAISIHAANGGPLKKSKPGAGRSELGMALLFIAPATIGFLVFYLYPTIRGFYFSLTKYNLLGTPALHRLRQLRQDRQRQAVLERAGGHVRVRDHQHRHPDRCSRSAIAVLMHRLTKSVVVRGTSCCRG